MRAQYFKLGSLENCWLSPRGGLGMLRTVLLTTTKPEQGLCGVRQISFHIELKEDH